MLHVQFHPGVSFTPGLSLSLSLVKSFFLYTCSTKVKSRFVVAILFVLTLVSDSAVLNGNDVLSILVVSTKNWYTSFLQKVSVFQKICSKVKLLKTFETFTDCHIKACRSLKRRAIQKIYSTVFQKNLCFFCWF